MSASTPVFSPSLIPSSAHAGLAPGYTLRPLASDDYARGFFECLEALTWTGSVTEAQFLDRFEWMRTRGAEWFHNLVIEHEGRIVATGVLIKERKFIWGLGSVGYIEDISVSEAYQGKGLGKVLVTALDALGGAIGCNKTILHCSDDKLKFYEKCAFSKTGGNMMGHKHGPTAEDGPKGKGQPTAPA